MSWRRSELTYCTNVHPGETLDEVISVIEGSLAEVRRKRRLSRMGSGLWLSRTTAIQLLQSEKYLKAFHEILETNGIDLFTLNGFPYGNFHHQRVKEQVYQPDWSYDDRLTYTLDLARILARILPLEQREGTISTVPLGFSADWNATHQQAALERLCRCLQGLHEIEQETGRSIRLCLEMEPGCVLEHSTHLLTVFRKDLPNALAERDMEADLLHRHLGICYDACHQAVMFEDTYVSLQRICQNGIPLGKIQLSNALELTDPNEPAALAELAQFAESRYLHQTSCRDASGHLQCVMDLNEALGILPRTHPWRCHFHVPIQSNRLLAGGLGTTQSQLLRVLDFLRDHRELHPHLEVETYTWQVLPAAIRPRNDATLIDGLWEELAWLEVEMGDRELLEDHTV